MSSGAGISVQDARSVAGGMSVAVVGGGIAGLAAAEAFLRAGARVTIVEASERLGGRIRTRRVGDWVLESGPDGYFAGSPALEALADRLDLRSEVVDVLPGWAGLVRRGRIIRLPANLYSGVPVDPAEILRLRALDPLARVRLLAEPLVQARRSGEAESLDGFLVRRLGRGAGRGLVGPLLAGVHSARASELDAATIAPLLVEAERRFGGIFRAARVSGTDRPRGRALRSLRNGMGLLVGRLEGRLRGGGVEVRTGRPSTVLRHAAEGWRLSPADGFGPYDVVVLALPPASMAELLAPLHPEAARIAARIESVDASLVHLVAEGAPADPCFHGAIAPPGESGDLSSFSVVTAKWPGRAGDDQTLIRVSLREGGDPEAASAAIGRLLGFRQAPRVVAVDRLQGAFPVQRLGHGERVSALRKEIERMPGLAIVGAAWDGTGLESIVAAAGRLPESAGVTAR